MADDDDGFLMSGSFVEKLKQVIRIVLGESASTNAPNRRVYEAPHEWQGILNEDLAAPTDGWMSPTKAKFVPCEIIPYSTTDPKQMRPCSFEFTAINRDPTLSANKGRYARVKRIDGDWVFTWVGR